jgi:hypothetical protein
VAVTTKAASLVLIVLARLEVEFQFAFRFVDTPRASVAEYLIISRSSSW